MPNVPIGKQSHDGSRTPTLREFLKAGRAVPRNCGVKTIFKPNKTPAYGLISEIGFRVSVNENSELYDAIDSLLEEWISGDSYIVICPDTAKPGQFTLELDTNETCEWEEFSWGWTLRLKERATTKTRSKKKPSVHDGGMLPALEE